MNAHEALYAELQDWAVSKEGLHDARDVAEAIGQLYAAAIVSMAPGHPVEYFRSLAPEMESLIEEMWAQSAEDVA